jgi:spermidine/putrescine transport system permease protein
MAQVELARPAGFVGAPRLGARAIAALQLAPVTAFLAVFFLVPVAIFLVYSFWVTRRYELVAEWTVANYSEALREPSYRDLLQKTVVIALLAAVITVAVAYPFAYAIHFRLRRFREPLLFLVLLALFSGYLVKIYAWKTILGNRGVINEILLRIGVIDDPLAFLLYSMPAALITFVNFLIPLAVLPIYSSMQNVRDEDVEAARDLGAGGFSAFRRVTLPLTRDGLLIAFAFSFIIAAGDYVTPQLVGGTSGAMIGKAIVSTFGVTFNWPLGSALAFLTLAAVVAILVAAQQVVVRVIR